MKKIIIVILLTLVLNNSKSQSLSDTLQWLKANIENKSAALFSGKKVSVLMDSLKPYKNCFKEYNRPVSYMNGSKIQRTVNDIKIYFDSVMEGTNGKGAFHDSVFFANHGKDTFNTHIPWILIKLRTPVLYKFAWYYSAPNGLGSLYWNNSLANLFRNAIVESVIVGEY